jgi:plastocyanin
MNTDFRQRVFLPIIKPIGIAVAFIGYAWALSRVLLAVPPSASTAIALGVAGYILALGAIVTAKPRITSRALAVGVSLGFVAIVAAGTAAGLAGPRPIHDEEAAAGEDPLGEGAEGGSAEGQGEAAPGTFVAVDIDFAAAPETLPAGPTTITLVNDGQVEHNVTIEGVNGDQPVVVAGPGATAEGEVDLAPATYNFFCSVPGHEANMSGELTVE